MCALCDLDLLVAIESLVDALSGLSADDINDGLKLNLIGELDTEPCSIRSVHLNRVIGFLEKRRSARLRLLFESERDVRALSCRRAVELFCRAGA